MSNPVFDWSGADNLTSSFGYGAIKLVKQLDDGVRSSYLCQLTEEAGEGYIELLTLSDGLSISIFNCHWLSAGEIYVDDGARTRLNFSLEMDIVMEFDEDDGVDMNQPSWRLINSAKNHTTHETYSAGNRTTWVTMAFTSHYLEKLFGNQIQIESEPLSALFTTPMEHSVYREYPLNHRLNQIASNMISSHLDDRLHLSYIESKGNELLCLAMDHILEDKKSPDTQVTLRQRDEPAILLARDLLLANLAQAPSIREICLMIGMNRNKLHYGFKQLFGMPISKYLQEERLAEAYRQLEMTDQNMLQIAMNVGFGHQSSFSTAFRKKYGFSPNELRKES